MANCFKNEKIFALIETHHTCDETDKLEIVGYKCFSLCRPKDKGVKYKASGGLAVYVHQSVRDGVSKIPTSGSENIILQLKSSFFGFEQDIQLFFSYCVPSNSSYRRRHDLDVYAELDVKLSSVPANNSTLLLGDLNARTGDGLDFIEDEDNTNVPIATEIYINDSVATFPRQNSDTGRNEYGVKLLELCRTVPLRICNGRKLGDLLGNPTCFQHGGLSSVDYGLVSPDLYDRVSTFSVRDPLPTLSDHAPIFIIIAFGNIHSTASLVIKQHMMSYTDVTKRHIFDSWIEETCKRCSPFLDHFEPVLLLTPCFLGFYTMRVLIHTLIFLVLVLIGFAVLSGSILSRLCYCPMFSPLSVYCKLDTTRYDSGCL